MSLAGNYQINRPTSAKERAALFDEKLSWPNVGEVTLRLAADVEENHGVLVTS